jgi:ubiquinone/menaquinone biosynthesis C-methylase UbiE
MNPGRHAFEGRWNHNTHYYSLLRAALPGSASSLLDVGCGDGTFCRFVAAQLPMVVGLDVEGRNLDQDDGVRYVVGSAEALAFADGSFAAITMSMVFHHVTPRTALDEAVRVLRPGGLLQVLGIGKNSGPRDLPHELRDVLTHRLHSRGRDTWDPPTAKAEPTQTWAQALTTARRSLPGCTWDRLPLWRYRVTWTKPDDPEDPSC